MRNVRVKIHINAPIERVFAEVSDHEVFLRADDGTATTLLRTGDAERAGRALQRGGLRFATMLAAVSFDLQRRVMDMEAAF